MRKVLPAILLFLFVPGCFKTGDWKQVLFRTNRVTFEDGKVVSAKELHLDSGKLMSNLVSIEGQIVATGDQFTHLLLSDDSGRILVQLTQIDEVEDYFRKNKPNKLRIVGTLERGKKGLPYVVAVALEQAG